MPWQAPRSEARAHERAPVTPQRLGAHRRDRVPGRVGASARLLWRDPQVLPAPTQAIAAAWNT